VLDVLDQMNELLDARQLRKALAVATAHLDVDLATSALDDHALRALLETTVMRAALDEHYQQYPPARPTRAEVARALAEQTG
jgi:hypothetical protein